MKSETKHKIRGMLESKDFSIITLVLLLLLFGLAITLSITNNRLEEQIIERDNHIRQLQYTDSVAKKLLDYVDKDSTMVLVTRWKDGHHQTYKEIAEERDSITREHYLLQNINQDLQQKIEIYESILLKCKENFPFDYKIQYYKDSIITEVTYRAIK